MSFTTGNDTNILQATNPAIVGAGQGNDRYVLDVALLAPGQKITLSDAQGANTLSLVGGLRIVSSKVASDALQLTLENGAVITVLGASSFTFHTGGNPLTGAGGLNQNYTQFVTQSLGVSVPAAGATPVDGGLVVVNQAGGTSVSTGGTYTLTADAPSITEGNSGLKLLNFTLTLDRAPTEAITVDYATQSTGTATAGADFLAVTGTVTFAPGQLSATVSVAVNGDTTVEPAETIAIKFTGTQLAAEVTAIGTVTNDDSGSGQPPVDGRSQVFTLTENTTTSTTTAIISETKYIDPVITKEVYWGDAATGEGIPLGASNLLGALTTMLGGTPAAWSEVDFNASLAQIASITIAGAADTNQDNQDVEPTGSGSVGNVGDNSTVEVGNGSGEAKEGDYTGNYEITITMTDGTAYTAEATLTDKQYAFINKLLFNEAGDSRLFEKEVTTWPRVVVKDAAGNPILDAEGNPVTVKLTEYEVYSEGATTTKKIAVPIILTPLVNNGGTRIDAGEFKYTNTGSDLIQAGRLELLHQAYIDGGAGEANTLEVDAKGYYAQPTALLNIQNIKVHNLPNVYSDTEGSTYPELTDAIAVAKQTSVLDLSRAVDLRTLTVTESNFEGLPDGLTTPGSLTLTGIRNGAVTTLDGSFSQNVFLNYGGVQADGVRLVLNNVNFGQQGDTEGNQLVVGHNSNTLNIESTGGGNFIANANLVGIAGEEIGGLTTLNVTGDARLFIEGDLDPSFHDTTPVTINASGNTAGVDLNLSGSQNVTFQGSQANDRFRVQTTEAGQTIGTNGTQTNDSSVTIVDQVGNNYFEVDAYKIDVTLGDGANNVEATGIVATLQAGNGNNHFELETIATRLTVGNGNNRIEIGVGDEYAEDTTNPSYSVDYENTAIVVAGNGDNTMDIGLGRYAAHNVTVTAGDGSNTINALGDVVTVTTGAGPDTIAIVGRQINVNTGAGDDTITVAGWGTDPSGVTDGVKLNINTGTGSATVFLGSDMENESSTFPFYGQGTASQTVTALSGSSITGENVTLFVSTKADLRGATLSGVEAIVLDDNGVSSEKAQLTLTDKQVAQLAAEGVDISVDGGIFNTGAHIKVVVTQNLDVTTGAWATWLSSLPVNVDIKFEINDGATLKLTAQQLHTKVASGGITIADDKNFDQLSGKVHITNAGLDFDPFNNNDAARTIIDGAIYEGGSLGVGSLGFANERANDNNNIIDRIEWGANVLIDRVANGYNRPADAPTYSRLTINTDEQGGTLGPLSTIETFLRITGDADMAFTPMKGGVDEWGAPVKGGTAIELGIDNGLPENDFIVDFSSAGGTISNLTLAHFQKAKAIYGNGSTNAPVRVNVEIDDGGIVASLTAGLVSRDVQTYVVTNISEDVESASHTAQFWTSRVTEDLQTLGLRGNYGDQITFGNTERGVKFLQEVAYDKFDGYAVGTLVANLARPAGGVATVNVQGLSTLPAGEVQKVAGVGTNASSLSVDVEGGNTVIGSITDSDASAVPLATLTLVADANLSITNDLPAALTSINAAGVVGNLAATIDSPTIDGLAFVGAAGGTTLTIDGAATGDIASIDGVGAIKLVIGGNDQQDATDLSATTLGNVTTITLKDGALLTLSQAQLNTLGTANLIDGGAEGSASLNLNGVTGPFDASSLDANIDIKTLTLAGTVDFAATASNLSGVDEIVVPAGATLTLTATQFQQLLGEGTIIGAGSVSITGLTQAHIDAELDLSKVIATGGLTIALAEDVNLASDTDLGGFSVVLAAGQTLGLATAEQADDLNVEGAADSTIDLLFSELPTGKDSINVSGYNVDALRFQDLLVNGKNVDAIFTGLLPRVEKIAYNNGVDPVDQTYTVSAGTIQRGDVSFDRLEDNLELEDFILNLQGGSVLDGSVSLAVSAKDAELIQTYLKTVTINSTGTAANPQTGKTDNIITGSISAGTEGDPQGTPPVASTQNELLDVTINADQNLVIQGALVFSAVVNANEVASLTFTGDADVSIGNLNTADEEVAGLNVVHNGTGTLTVGIDAANIDAKDALSFTGPGAVLLNVTGDVDLSNDTLDAVSAINVAEQGTVTLTVAQALAIGEASLQGTGTVALTGLADQALDTTLLGEDLAGVSVTTAAGTWTLNAGGNLSAVTDFTIGEGSVVTMTAAQALQLEGVTFEAGADSELHITGVTQADLDAGLGNLLNTFGGHVAIGTITLAEDVTLTAAQLNTATGATGFTLLGNDVRVNVDMDATTTVGVDAENGIKSTGVSSYVVTETDVDATTPVTAGTIFVCNDTVGLETLGLQENAGYTITFDGIKRGVDFVMEADGVANWDQLEKEQAETDVTSIGALVANFYTANNPSATVNIGNRGVELGVASDGGERVMTVDGITINNTLAVTVNVTNGDATIGNFSADDATALTLTASEDLTVWIRSEGELATINATGVVGQAVLGVGTAGADLTDTTTYGDATVDLSATSLSGIDAIALADESVLTLNGDQAEAFNSALMAAGDGIVLNINGFDNLFDADLLPEGVSLGTVTLAAGPITLDPSVNLSGAAIVVPEGGSLTLTAAQFAQLDGAITSVDTDGDGDDTEFTVNITGLTQADIDAGFDLSGITGNVNVTLAGDVDFDDTTTVLTTSLDDLSIDLAGFTLNVATYVQADGLNVSGTGTSTLELGFDEVPNGEVIDASGYNVPELKAVQSFFTATNGQNDVEVILGNLPESTTLIVTAPEDLGFISGITRTVVLEEGARTPVGLIFNDQQNDREVIALNITFEGDARIQGDLDLQTIVPTDALARNFGTLTLVSTGTAGLNMIDGIVTAGAEGASSENNLLDVVINGDQAFRMDGIQFSYITNSKEDGAGEDLATIGAELTVNNSANVTIDALDVSDPHVQELTVTNTGAGNLTLDITDATVTGTPDGLSFLGDNIVLNIAGTADVDLSDADLAGVNTINLENGSELILTADQLDTLGSANLTIATGDTAELNLVGFGNGNQPFDVANLADGITLVDVTMEAGVVTLDPATDLGQLNSIIVPAGGTLNLTAAQYVAMGEPTITGGLGSIINISELSNAQADIDLSGITGFGSYNLTLADDVGVPQGYELTVPLPTGNLILGVTDVNGQITDTADLGNFALNLVDGDQVTLVTLEQADARTITGTAGATVSIALEYASVDGNEITFEGGATAYGIQTENYSGNFLLEVLNTLVQGQNVEAVLANLASAITVQIVAPAEMPGAPTAAYTDRVVNVDVGVTVDDNGAGQSLIFADLNDNRLVKTLTINLLGDSTVAGDIDVSTLVALDGYRADYFETLSINSQGAEANAIDDITAGSGTTENNLLDVNITATQALTGGTIFFQSVNSFENEATATLDVAGTANVTLKAVDTTDADVQALAITNNGGTLTLTGASPSGNVADTETLTLSGSGGIVFGTGAADTNGINGGGDLSTINASALSGDLTIIGLDNIDSAAFTFTSGTGVNNVTLDDVVLADGGVWSFNFIASTGGQFELNGDANFSNGGSLTIAMGAATNLVISDDIAFTYLDSLTLTGTGQIILENDAVVVLTADQASAITAAGFTVVGEGTVNIIGLDNGVVYDFSAFSADVAGTITLAETDVTVAETTDLGEFSITLQAVNDGNTAGTELAGQTIRFNTPEQAERDVIVTTNTGVENSTNVVWLFDDVLTASIDTSGYFKLPPATDAYQVGRLWLNEALIAANNGDVESLFTTLPFTTLRLEFSDLDFLNVLLSSNGVDRVLEVVSFQDVSSTGLTFSDVQLQEHIQSLTLKLGGQVNLGDVEIGNLFVDPSQVDVSTINFSTLTIESSRVMKTGDLLAPQGFSNDNDGSNEPGENVQPANLNTIGNINATVGNVDLELTNVVINTGNLSVAGNDSAGAGAKLEVGTITFSANENTVAELGVSGANSTTIASLDTSDADITGIAVTNSGPGALTVTGASPAAAVSNTETLTIDATGAVTLGTAGDADKPGVAGADLSAITVTGTGVVNLGVIAQIDGSNDGSIAAFTLDGSGKTTTFGVLGQANVGGVPTAPTLQAGSTWNFQDATLTLTDDVVLGAGTVSFDNVALTISGDVDFTTLAQLTLDATDVTIDVPAGNSLTILAEDADGLTITGGGVVNVMALEDTPDADLSDIMTGGTDTGTVEAALDSTGNVELTGDLGIAHVTISGNGTVTVDNLATMADSTFTVGAAATLSLHADQADGRVVDGAGTTNIEDIGLAGYAANNDVDYSTVASAQVNIAVNTSVELDSDDNLGAAGANRDINIGAGATLTAAGSVITGHHIHGENATLLVDDENDNGNDNTAPADTAITADLSNVDAEFITLVAKAEVGTITFPVLYGSPAAKDLDGTVAVQTVTLTAAQASGQTIDGASAGTEGEVVVTALGAGQTNLSLIDVGRATAFVPADATLNAGTNLGEFAVVLDGVDVDLTLTAAQADGRSITDTGTDGDSVTVTALELAPAADLSAIDVETETALLNADGNVALSAKLGSNMDVIITDTDGLGDGVNTVTFTGTLNPGSIATPSTTFQLNDAVKLVMDANLAHNLTVTNGDASATSVTVNNVDGDLMDLTGIAAATLVANVPADAVMHAGTNFGGFNVVLAEGADLTLSFTQFLNVGVNDAALDAVDFSSAAGGVEEIITVTDWEPLVALDTSVLLAANTLALKLVVQDTDTTVVVNSATNLSGVEEIVIPAGTTLNMTADQFQQIQTSATVTGAGTLNITNLDSDNADIDLSSVTALAGTITLESDVAVASGVATKFELSASLVAGDTISVEIEGVTYTAAFDTSHGQTLANFKTAINASGDFAAMVEGNTVTIRPKDPTVSYDIDTQFARTGAGTAVASTVQSVYVVLDPAAVLNNATGGKFAINYTGVGQSLTLANEVQADGRTITDGGFADTVLVLGFTDASDVGDTNPVIVASGFSVDNVWVLNDYLFNEFGISAVPANFEFFLEGLASGLPVTVYDTNTLLQANVLTPGALTQIDRTVTVDQETTAQASFAFNVLSNGAEVRNLTLNLEGNSVIVGNLQLPQDKDPNADLNNPVPADDSLPLFFNTLTINSTNETGLSTAPNRITGAIFADNGSDGAGSESHAERFVLTLNPAMSITGNEGLISFDGAVLALQNGWADGNVAAALAGLAYNNWTATDTSTAESTTFTVGALAAGQTVTINGLTVTATAAATAAEVAAAFGAGPLAPSLTVSGAYGTPAGWAGFSSAYDGAAGTVTFTNTVNGDATNFTASTGTNPATAVVTNGVSQVEFLNKNAGVVTNAVIGDFQFVANNGSTVGLTGTVATTDEGSFAANENNLYKVVINATHDLIIEGELELRYLTRSDKSGPTPAETVTGTIDVYGTANVTIGSVNSDDIHITGVTLTNHGTGTVSAPGTSPGAAVSNTEVLTINVVNALGVVNLGTAGDASKPGVSGADLSLIDVNGEGDANLGVIALVDSMDFYLDATGNSGDVTATIGATLAVGGVWTFANGVDTDPEPLVDNSGTLNLTINEDAVFTSGSTLNIQGATITIDGNIDLSVVDLSGVANDCEFVVLAGSVLTLSVEQVLAFAGDTIRVSGGGTVKVVGDATDLVGDVTDYIDDQSADLGAVLQTTTVDLSGVTLNLADDLDDVLGFQNAGASGVADADQNLIGSGEDDWFLLSSNNDTVTGGAGNDTYVVGAGTSYTFNVDAGDDTITDGFGGSLATGDVLIVNDVATVTAEGIAAFVATAATVNNGTANLSTAATGGEIDVSAAGGTGDFNLTGGVGADVLIGSERADVILGGDGQDVLTGNGGADIFRFTTSTSTPVTMTVETTTPGEDWERVDITGGADADGGTITIPYSVNNGATFANLTVTLLGSETADQVAALVRAAFTAAGFNAVLDGASVEVRGAFGSTLQLDTFVAGTSGVTGSTGNATTNLDIAQETTVTLGGAAVVVGETYSLDLALAGGSTLLEVNQPATTTAASDVVTGLAALVNGLAAVTALGVGQVLTITDAEANNGGFTVSESSAGGFNGSSASATKADASTYDLIEDFGVGADKIDLQGLVAGSLANYREGGENATLVTEATFADALATAEAQINGTVRYFLTSVDAAATGNPSENAAAGKGVLFFDADGDGLVDGGVLLTGVTSANFAFGDITASPVPVV